MTPDSKPNLDPQQEAFERGRRQAHVDGELESHEKRLNAINGNIERHAEQASALKDSIEELKHGLDALRSTLNTRAAIEADRVKQIKTANERQISNRTFWLGVAAIIVTVITAFLVNGGHV